MKTKRHIVVVLMVHATGTYARNQYTGKIKM